ncbi:hypothetical protein D3C80_1476840 [compost metagenome]
MQIIDIEIIRLIKNQIAGQQTQHCRDLPAASHAFGRGHQMVDSRHQHRRANQTIQRRLRGQPVLNNTITGATFIVHVVMTGEKRLVAGAAGILIILSLLEEFTHGGGPCHDRERIVIQT